MKNLCSLFLTLLFFPLLTAKAQHIPSSQYQKPVPEATGNRPQKPQPNNPYRSLGAQENFGPTPEYSLVSVFTGQQNSEIKKIAADEQGNIYVAGEYSDTLRVNGSTYTDQSKRSLFIAKFNADGNLLWIDPLTKGQSGYSTASVEDMAVSEDKLVLSARYQNGSISVGGNKLPAASEPASVSFLTTYNTDGQHLWTNHFQHTNKGGKLSLHQTIIFYLHSEDRVTEFSYGGNKERDIFLPENVQASHLAVQHDQLFITGTITDHSSFGEHPVWANVYAHEQAFITRYDLSTNEYLWVKISNPEPDQDRSTLPLTSLISSLQIQDDLLYITGHFPGGSRLQWGPQAINGNTSNTSAYTAKFSTNGELAWLKELENTQQAIGCFAGNGHFTAYGPELRNFFFFNEGGDLIKSETSESTYHDILYRNNNFIMGGINDYRFTLEKSDANPANVQWQLTDEQKGGSIIFHGLEIDEDAKLYHLAEVEGTVRVFGQEHEGKGLLLIKTNARGEHLWTRFFSNSRTSLYGRNIRLDPEEGTIYITGHSKTTVRFGDLTFEPPYGLEGFLAKITSSGELEWLQHLPRNTQGIALDSQKNVYSSGTFNIPFTVGNIASGSPQGRDDAYLIKFNSLGEPQWGNFYGGEEQEYCGLVAVDYHDNVYFSGEFLSRNIRLPENKTLSLAETDGNILLIKLDAEGHAEWEHTYASGEHNKSAWPTSIEISPENNIIMNGWVGHEGTFDHITLTSPFFWNHFVATIMPDGSTQWARLIRTDPWGFNYNQMAIDEDGGIYVGGKFSKTLDFEEHQSSTESGPGVYLAKYNADGSFAYATTMPMDAHHPLGGLTTSNTDDIFINGYFIGEASLGNANLKASDYSGYFANLSFPPKQPAPPQGAREAIVDEEFILTLPGKGRADEVLVQTDPSEAVKAYSVKGDKLIIRWNPGFTGSEGGKTTAETNVAEVSIAVAYRNNSGTSPYSEAATVSLNTTPNGLEEVLFGGSVVLYPNPSETYLILEFPQSNPKDVHLSILDIRGSILQRYTIEAESSGTSITTSGLPKGIYLIKFQTEEGSFARRFVKK